MVSQPLTAVIRSCPDQKRAPLSTKSIQNREARTGDQAVATMGKNPYTSQVATLATKSPTVDYTTAVVMRY